MTAGAGGWPAGRKRGGQQRRGARRGRGWSCGGADAELAAAYDRARPRLVRVAYAVLGSRCEAEDVVSECWLRRSAADARDPVKDVDAWATVAVALRVGDDVFCRLHNRLA